MNNSVVFLQKHRCEMVFFFFPILLTSVFLSLRSIETAVSMIQYNFFFSLYHYYFASHPPNIRLTRVFYMLSVNSKLPSCSLHHCITLSIHPPSHSSFTFETVKWKTNRWKQSKRVKAIVQAKSPQQHSWDATHRRHSWGLRRGRRLRLGLRL